MLDLFTIFSKGGIVLWYFQGTTQLFTNSVNELIKTVMLQERGQSSSSWNHDTLTLQYKLDNEFELVFVVAYQNILKLTYIDKFLSEIALRFRDKYKQEIVSGAFAHNFADFRADFDEVLDECEREAESRQADERKPRKFEESAKASKTVASMIETKKTGGILGSIVNTVAGGGGGGSSPGDNSNNKKANKNATTTAAAASQKDVENTKPATNGLSNGHDEFEEMEKRTTTVGTGGKPRKFVPKSKSGGPTASPKSPSQQQKKGKQGTVWEEKVDLNSLNYGEEAKGENGEASEELTAAYQYVKKDQIGKSRGELKPVDVGDDDADYDDEYEENNNSNKTAAATKSQKSKNSNSSAAKKATASSGGGGGGLFSSLRGLVGGKTLTADVIEPVMEKMQEHLVAKNVAAEIAQKVCSNVAQNLEGKQLGSFQFAATIIKQALHESMVQILTPKKRVDILRDVFEAQRQRRPYVIVFCGVNGVGKSTNLAKVAFWLIENSFRVLIAACDTFRSGAVEQLKTHMRHLNALHPADEHDGKTMVQLFEKGYGKDAASIAHDAISSAKESGHDVVLIDTAGRMQDNEPLMKALAKLININNPDLVLFVGEALVGNEAVDQVRKFNQALIDNSPVKTSSPEQVRTIDGIVLTKFDTIDDKVGAAISMAYTTGQPIVFVGTGQTYSDLKSLNAESVVKSLLK